MTTRALIIIHDRNDTFALYKHGDGTPSICKKWFEDAQKYAWTAERWDPGDFTAAMIRVMKNEPGHVYVCDPEDMYDNDYTFEITVHDNQFHFEEIDV